MSESPQRTWKLCTIDDGTCLALVHMFTSLRITTSLYEALSGEAYLKGESFSALQNKTFTRRIKLVINLSWYRKFSEFEVQYCPRRRGVFPPRFGLQICFRVLNSSTREARPRFWTLPLRWLPQVSTQKPTVPKTCSSVKQTRETPEQGILGL